MDTFQKLFPQAYLSRFLERGFRTDGRRPNETRPCKIVDGTFGGADGSCTVSLGRTCVACGVSYMVTTPAPDAPSRGRIDVRVLMNLLNSSNSDASEIGRSDAIQEFVTRVLSTLIVLDDLCIVPGQAIWVLKVDAYCLDDDGNLIDACLLAIIGALRDFRFPSEILIDPITNEVRCCVVDTSHAMRSTKSLKFVGGRKPFPLTFGIFQGMMLADPSSSEEQVLTGTLSIVIDAVTGEILAMSKPGGPVVGINTLKECTSQAQTLAKRMMGGGGGATVR